MIEAPLSKSVANRLMVLSLLNKDYDYFDFLTNYPQDLSDDILVVYNIMKNWYKNDFVDVGESRTSLIFTKELASVQKKEKLYKMRGTLAKRKLDNTSQTISAKLLCGEDIPQKIGEPYHVALTRKVIKLWNERRKQELFEMKDETLSKQCDWMEHFIRHQGKSQSEFKIQSAEDVCLGYWTGQITLEEIIEQYPSAMNHESNRPMDLLKTYIQYQTGKAITSRDHRVVMAVSFFALAKRVKLNYQYRDCVNKSFPLWWQYLMQLQHLQRYPNAIL